MVGTVRSPIVWHRQTESEMYPVAFNWRCFMRYTRFLFVVALVALLGNSWASPAKAGGTGCACGCASVGTVVNAPSVTAIAPAGPAVAQNGDRSVRSFSFDPQASASAPIVAAPRYNAPAYQSRSATQNSSSNPPSWSLFKIDPRRNR